jgi:hypothetical protein
MMWIKKAFDIKNRYFVTQTIKDWKNNSEQQIFTDYIEDGAELIGELNNYYLFIFPPPPKDRSYEYSLQAIKVTGINSILSGSGCSVSPAITNIPFRSK